MRKCCCSCEDKNICQHTKKLSKRKIGKKVHPLRGPQGPPGISDFEDQEFISAVQNIIQDVFHEEFLTLTFSNNVQTQAVDDKLFLIGSFEMTPEVDNITGDYNTPFALSHNNLYIKVNSFTGTQTLTINGRIVDKHTLVSMSGSETITIDEATTYQTYHRYHAITSIIVSGGSGINYGIGRIGYFDDNQEDMIILGYRTEIEAQIDTDMRLQILNIRDLGNNKFDIFYLEDLEFNNIGTGEVIDHIRTGANNRNMSGTPVNFWPDDSKLFLGQNDFLDYFDESEYSVNSSMNGGLIIIVTGDGLDNTGSPNMWFRLKYRHKSTII